MKERQWFNKKEVTVLLALMAFSLCISTGPHIISSAYERVAPRYEESMGDDYRSVEETSVSQVWNLDSEMETAPSALVNRAVRLDFLRLGNIVKNARV